MFIRVKQTLCFALLSRGLSVRFTPGAPFKSFELLEGRQRGLVLRVARINFVGQRETFRCNHQRDDHPGAVGAVVAAVAEFLFALAARRRRVGLLVRVLGRRNMRGIVARQMAVVKGVGLHYTEFLRWQGRKQRTFTHKIPKNRDFQGRIAKVRLDGTPDDIDIIPFTIPSEGA
jgi:hypothetical protein